MTPDIIRRICTWYRAGRRDLPWRKTRDPYRVWVSEIMLQQTRASAVIPYYSRFLKRLPRVEDLAVCPDDELMKLWEGLGYYSRARHMKETAGIISERYGGIFPSDPETLRTLPGIGRYTAGAVASIAYGVPVAAVDGNVLRIMSRITCSGGDVLNDKVKRETEEILTDAIGREADAGGEDENFPGDVNQGFMDLGATVCLPHTVPLCGECPLAELCGAHRTGRESDFPVRKTAKRRKTEERTVLLILDGDRVVLRKRPERGLLAGMYEYPCLDGFLTEKEALRETERLGFEPVRIQPLPTAVHIFTHLEWHMTGYKVNVASFRTGAENEKDSGIFLVDIRTAEKKYAIPSAFRVYSSVLYGSDNDRVRSRAVQKSARDAFI
jgi:A/G-specific adenine glycosylase